MDAETTIGPVHLRWIDAAAPLADTAPLLAAVGPDQRRRHRALSGSRARRFLAGRMLLRALIDQLAPGASAELTARCRHCGGDHGAPEAPASGLLLSVSYAGDLVAVAAAERAAVAEIGIDLVAYGAGSASHAETPLPELAPLFNPYPPPTPAGWSRIEATVKADGRGLRIPPADIAITPAPPGSLLGGCWRAHVPGRRRPIEVTTVAGPAGHVVSVAASAARR